MHALVIGGTGMLAKASLWLVNEGYNASVIGRNPIKMNRLINTSVHQSRLTPLLVDYTNDSELRNHIKMGIKKNGPIDLVIAWIHSVGKNAFEIVLEEVSNNNHTWRLFHVLGSSANLSEIKKKATVPDNCLYRQVQLGFIIENGKSRWLTHDEISNGVIDAISNDIFVKTVGTLEPWEQRP